MPAQHRGRLHDEQTRPPACPAPAQPRPEDPIPPAQPRSLDGPLQHCQLMTQRRVLQGDDGRPEHERAEKGPDTEEKDHGRLPRTQLTAEMRRYSQAGPSAQTCAATSRMELLTRTGERAARPIAVAE